MMKKADYITTITYECGGGFFVDIVENTREKVHRAYIYHENYGIKSLMFGCPASTTKHHDFFEMVVAGIEEYKEDYINEYMDDYL